MRRRRCDSPPPDPDGQPCNGADNETKTCNSDKCPGNESGRSFYKSKLLAAFEIVQVLYHCLFCILSIEQETTLNRAVATYNIREDANE